MSKNDDQAQQSDGENTYQSPAKNVFDKFVRNRDVALIYGDPVKHGNKTVLPVARMKYSFGAGGGQGKDGGLEEQSSTEGGGGHFSVRPVGVYEIGRNRVRFKPTIDVKSTLTILSLLSLGTTWLLNRKRRR